ncbi:hypothetical protein NEH16_11270 [Streptomyces drozdowiczii]|uniref:Lipoprotein n=1 Tax=Streptomyces drozdowiczii TaxID=202862 RepID=A0ABY6PR96_9ACTN|nr:hypothetical protein [Streptomyces drozdowiczii]UZK54642.1 hypothetical protein NEH16_11270 [Streptomyces drozdowiczii]
MTFVRRTAALLLTASALTGCGTELVSDGGAASPAPSASGQGVEQGGDANPHYAENHAFQSTLDLSEADRVRGEAEVKRVKRGLAALAEGQKSTEDSVFHALHALGYPDGSVTTGTFGPHRTSFTVTLGTLCVDGSLDGVVNGLVNAEAHGRYMEGTGCVKPRGGH